MRPLTKIIHKVISILHLESIVIFLSSKITFFKKFIPLNKSYPNPTIRKVKRDNAWFLLNISDYMQWHIWANINDLSWELALKNFIPGASIIDIGTNVGAFTLKTAANLSKKSIPFNLIGFEPNPYVYNQLLSNIEINKSLKPYIKPISKGISNQQEELNFEYNENNSGGGKFIINPQKKSSNSEKIEVIPLDEFVKENDIKNISFIKIDVEGFEPFVVEGALKTIQTHLPNMYIEITPDWWKKNGYTTEEILRIFEKLGYSFYPAYEEKLDKKESLENLTLIENQYNLFLTIH